MYKSRVITLRLKVKGSYLTIREKWVLKQPFNRSGRSEVSTWSQDRTRVACGKIFCCDACTERDRTVRPRTKCLQFSPWHWCNLPAEPPVPTWMILIVQRGPGRLWVCPAASTVPAIFAGRESNLQNDYLCTSIWFLEGHLLTASLSTFALCCPSFFVLPLLLSTLVHFTPQSFL